MMESIMLAVKFLLFFALEFTVLVIIGTVLVAGLYQIVRDKVHESRQQDKITPETGSTGSAAARHP